RFAIAHLRGFCLYVIFLPHHSARPVVKSLEKYDSSKPATLRLHPCGSTVMMIQVENLTKYFGPVLAVDHVTFDVDQGEIVGFLGLNGAGKTTTMRILTSYLPATSGIARVAGFDVMTQSLAVRRNIGYLPESVPLYAEMRVEEYILFRAKLKGVPRKDRVG